MSSHPREATQGHFESIDTNEEYSSTSGIEMGSTEIDKAETEFHLANDTVEASPRSAQSGTSSEVFGSSTRKNQKRPKSARISAPKDVPRVSSPVSSIPLPVKTSGPIKIPSMLKNTKSASKTVHSTGPRTTSLANKHTLEIQFINKSKRYIQLRKELEEKQRPIMDLYQNLTHIKRRLEEFGKNVKLEEIRLVTFEDINKKPPTNNMGGGEQISMEVVNSMKSSIEEIPKTLMDICKNLLSRRALIVELLESVTKSEVDMTQVSDKIESLKCEGQQLQQSLDAVIHEHELKISTLVGNWQKLLSDKQCYNTDTRIVELETKVKEEERLREESSTIIHDLHRKMEDRRLSYDRSIGELNGVLQTLKEQIKKLEQDLESERKTSIDFKTRNNSNAQNLKAMRSKITELENDKKDVESSNTELQKKIRLLQEQLKHKEGQWLKEKEEMTKSLKHQENLLQKITADKNQFETRLETVETSKQATETELQASISCLKEQLQLTQTQLSDVTAEKNEAVEKCTGFESYIARMGAECKETMNRVSYSIEWGKAVREVKTPEAEKYMQNVAKDLRIRELEDKIDDLESERVSFLRKLNGSKDEIPTTKVELELKEQKERIKEYQVLLEETEDKLKDKLNGLRTTEVEHLRAEIRQLKVRQDSLEEQNELCSPEEVTRLLEEGRQKLHELMTRSIQSENRAEEYITMLEKQKCQMTEMDNLIRYRENMANVLKASRNELLMEKESLVRYSREVRCALAEVTSQSKVKDEFIRNLEDKVTLRETQVQKLEGVIQDLEEKLQTTNEKRYKLQDTVGTLERELQGAQAKLNQVSEVKTMPGRPWSFLDSVYEVVDDKPNKKVSHYCNSLIDGPDENVLSVEHYDDDIISTQHTPRKKLNNFRNLSVIDKHSSIHTHCHHKANSRSLISLSLQTVDFLKTKLKYLTSVNAEAPETAERIAKRQRSSTQTKHFNRAPHRNLSKILELTAHRYEYLQNQAQESYEDLSKLVKLAVNQKGRIKE